MASRKEYTYQIKGNKLSLLEKDFSTTDGLNYTFSGTAGDGITDDIPSGTTVVKSPLSSVTDGIEIEYAYSPNYIINDASDTASLTGYSELGGFLHLTNAVTSVAQDEWILIKGSNKIDGLHQVNETSTTDTILTKTRYNGSTVTGLTGTIYHDVSVLTDESSEIDVPPYLSKALVYYVKAKVAEDQMEIDAKEYFMNQFRKMVEKHENSKVPGPRVMMTGNHAIR